MTNDLERRQQSGRYHAPIGQDTRRDYAISEDRSTNQEFSSSEDSDGNYLGASKDVIGAQPVDYSSLELLQQNRNSAKRAPRGSQPASGGIAANSTLGRGSRGGPKYNAILRTTRGVRNSNAGFNKGARLYNNPTTPATESQRHSGRRRERRGNQVDDSVHSHDDIEDITRVDEPPHTPAIRTTRRGSERRGGQRQHRITGLWSDDQLWQAIAAVDDGMSMRKAATTFKIPYSSFREWCHGIRRTKKKGPPTVLSLEEEDELVKYLIQMCDRGYGLSPTALRMKVYEITQSRWTPFRNGIPGNGWMRWWKRRHPDLTLGWMHG